MFRIRSKQTTAAGQVQVQLTILTAKAHQASRFGTAPEVPTEWYHITSKDKILDPQQKEIIELKQRLLVLEHSHVDTAAPVYETKPDELDVWLAAPSACGAKQTSSSLNILKKISFEALGFEADDESALPAFIDDSTAIGDLHLAASDGSGVPTVFVQPVWTLSLRTACQPSLAPPPTRRNTKLYRRLCSSGSSTQRTSPCPP